MLRINVKILIDGYFIRSMLISFFYNLYRWIIEDGRLYIASPPLYRVDDKKNPFVTDKREYIRRYAENVAKDYKVGYNSKSGLVDWFDKKTLSAFLSDTSNFAEDFRILSEHYKTNDRLLEMILEEIAWFGLQKADQLFNDKNIDIIRHMMDRISLVFPEVTIDEQKRRVSGIVDGKRQLIEIDDGLIYRCRHVIKLIDDWGPIRGREMMFKNVKTAYEEQQSMLVILKVLAKYQPKILHRFKGL